MHQYVHLTVQEQVAELAIPARPPVVEVSTTVLDENIVCNENIMRIGMLNVHIALLYLQPVLCFHLAQVLPPQAG